MTTIENRTKYYLYDRHKCQQVREFVSEDDLKDWLVFTTREVHHWWSKTDIKNTYLDEIALNTNDTMEYVDPKTLCGTIAIRRYMFTDEHGRIIDARVYWPEVKAKFIAQNERKYNNRIPDNAQYGEVFHRYSWCKGTEYRYKYRCGPVPRTAYHWRGHCYRHPHTRNEYIQNTDPEYGIYTRGKRKHLPTVWDELYLERGKSWKDCTKKKKQWM